jgi:hypothetical protein
MFILYTLLVGRVSSVVTGWGSNPGGGRDFSSLAQTGPGVHLAPCTMHSGSFPGVKRPERDVDHAPSSRAEVKVRVEVYLHSPFGPS